MFRLAACLAVVCVVAVSAGCGGSGLLTKQGQVYVVPAAGGKIRRLTSGGQDSLGPAWSPDGKRLALVSGGALEAVALNGGRPVKLTRPGVVTPESPSWSPDGRRLAVTEISSDEMTATVVSVGSDGGSSKVIARTRAGTSGSGRGPVWSPGGRSLAYSVQGPLTPAQGGVRASGDLDLAVVSPGGTPKRLTSAPGNESDPRWSPHGRWILYDSESSSEDSSALRLVPAGGGRSHIVVRLAYVSGASWSPDGTLIAFAGSAPGELRMHLYVVRPDGTGLRRLTGEITPDCPAWSPDGKLIAFGTYASGIDVVASDGTGRRTIVAIADADIRGLAWSPDGKTIAFAARKQQPET